MLKLLSEYMDLSNVGEFDGEKRRGVKVNVTK